MHLVPARSTQKPDSPVKGKNVMVITDERTFGFHALRHSLATLLVSKDVDPKTVQAMLRHSNVTTTLQLYAKTVDGKRLKAQEQVFGGDVSDRRPTVGGDQASRMRIMGGAWVEAVWVSAAKSLIPMVSAAGFEPATHALKGRCSTN